MLIFQRVWSFMSLAGQNKAHEKLVYKPRPVSEKLKTELN